MVTLGLVPLGVPEASETILNPSGSSATVPDATQAGEDSEVESDPEEGSSTDTDDSVGEAQASSSASIVATTKARSAAKAAARELEREAEESARQATKSASAVKAKRSAGSSRKVVTEADDSSDERQAIAANREKSLEWLAADSPAKLAARAAETMVAMSADPKVLWPSFTMGGLP